MGLTSRPLRTPLQGKQQWGVQSCCTLGVPCLIRLQLSGSVWGAGVHRHMNVWLSCRLFIKVMISLRAVLSPLAHREPQARGVNNPEVPFSPPRGNAATTRLFQVPTAFCSGLSCVITGWATSGLVAMCSLVERITCLFTGSSMLPPDVFLRLHGIY